MNNVVVDDDDDGNSDGDRDNNGNDRAIDICLVLIFYISYVLLHYNPPPNSWLKAICLHFSYFCGQGLGGSLVG